VKTPPSSVVGQVKTALILGTGVHATAAVCTILARIHPATTDSRVSARGVINFDSALIDHVERQVLPVVDAITHVLRPEKESWAIDLAARNLGAASILDVGAAVTGFSADTAILLAVLSARLGIAVRQDVMTSGHLSSDRGDLGPVRGLSEKLAAAAADPSVGAYIIASLSSDASVERMLPTEWEQMAEAVIRARRHFRVIEVTDVGQLIREAFDDESVVLGSLSAGFFDHVGLSAPPAMPIDSAIQFLSGDLPGRFWQAAEHRAFGTDPQHLHRLFDARATFEMGQAKYPAGFGRKLHALIRSLPPTIRRRAGLFPLLPAERCLALCRAAQPDDLEDVQELLLANSGKAPTSSVDRAPSTATPSGEPDPGIAALLAEISVDSLARKIDAPIDTARAVFALDRITVESDEEFWATIGSFYITLLRHTGSERASMDSPIIKGECHKLLNKAFANEGGVDAARQEGRHPTRGGLRYVLDVCVNHFKLERQSDYIRAVVAEAFDSRDWPATVRFMAALLEHIRPCLPPDVAVDSPAQLAPRCADILMTYVRSRDRMTQLIRSL